MKSTILSLITLLLFSCEKISYGEELLSADPYANFDYLWQECNDKYTYFDLKQIDWNAVRTKYSAMLSPEMTEEELFEVLGGMLTELKDDHTNLRSNFNISRFGVEYTAQDNFDWRIIVDHYIGQDHYISGPFNHNFIKESNIGYVRLSSFTRAISSSNLNFILDKYQDTQGLIIDIRDNGGGSLGNVYSILERLIDQKTKLFYSRVKTGAGKNDFSATEPVYLAPFNGRKYLKKVALLTDRGSYSASSFLALATDAIPKIVRIGDTTGGGLGAPNGGQLPNGWFYRFSVSQTLSLALKPDFEMGVPPNIPAQIDWVEREKDEIIESALIHFSN